MSETAAAALRRVLRHSPESKGVDFMVIASPDVDDVATVRVSMSAQFSRQRSREAHSDVVVALFTAALASLAESSNDAENAVLRIAESALRIVRRDPELVPPT